MLHQMGLLLQVVAREAEVLAGLQRQKLVEDARIQEQEQALRRAKLEAEERAASARAAAEDQARKAEEDKKAVEVKAAEDQKAAEIKAEEERKAAAAEADEARLAAAAKKEVELAAAAVPESPKPDPAAASTQVPSLPAHHAYLHLIAAARSFGLLETVMVNGALTCLVALVG